MSVLGWIILLIVLAAIVIALAAWFYERATNEVSLVKTGIGGRKVIIDGGTLAIPYFHEISRVNMQTIRMDVTRRGESALITKDRMRVDVSAEFYASVVPSADAIARAAQTLGRRTFQPDELKALIDGMMVDALRAVAAQMTMDQLHEDRAEFVREVRDALHGTIERYGLQLDSVSLTELDQTPFSALDDNNAFNAVGMRKLAEVISKSKKERAQIEGDSEVEVRRTAMEASRRKLEIDLEERRAEIAQAQEVESLMAAQLAEVARRKADAEREAAHARIRMEQEIQSADIARELAVREAEIAQARALQIAEQDRQIQISAKSQEESRARAEADTARAEAVKAEEAIQTARQLAEAERRKQVALLAAQQDAETAATRARIAAESEKATAKDRKEAKREEAEAVKLLKLAEAEAERARIEAENARSDALMAMELEKMRLQAMPGIVAQMVKPAEKIDRISINHISGLGARGGVEPGEAKAGSPVSQIVDSILDMSVALPAMNKLGEIIGEGVGQDAEKGKGA
ncbi:flotillin family protein [Sinisalibacter aestuarii]|uniref:Inner membrane protein YqiK n=1 Tax=Sinisalibacter aestuarii TaxID=2949426 RepID=A0ABQ5M011_9RHOB|nr:flotillin domain-containing protein [Sinisalibacter aestuarii]GKY90100.1 inner membrane protein YqiK [Sinisalibacter aestuarii]